MGLLVRGSGLLEAVAPPLLAWVVLRLALRVVGDETVIAHVAEVLFLPWVLYVLGAKVLDGLTRQISRGRPALVSLHSATVARLQRTYANVGVVVALAYALDGLARVVIGDGRVVSLIDSIVLVWLCVWAVWEAIRWRVPLAETWITLLPSSEDESVERRIATWMARSYAGFVLSLFVATRLLTASFLSFVSQRATGTTLGQSLRARLLRRRMSQRGAQSTQSTNALPDQYLAAFPLYPILGEDDALLVSRGTLVNDVVEQWERWKETRADGSLVLIGEKGSGKTTLAAQVALRVNSMAVAEHTLIGKFQGEEPLVRDLAQALGIEGASTVDELTARIHQAEERVVLVDEVHNIFLRSVDGYRAYDALVEIVNATANKIFWVLIFNSFTWEFLNQSRGRVHYFRRLLFVPKWKPEEIEKLIRLRNERTGYALRFEEMLLPDSRSDLPDLELVEEAEGYFRLLWESSGGNPRVATHLWLSSLTLIEDKLLGVGAFPEPSTEKLASLQDELIFALAALCQHENLSASELALVLNMSEGFARFAKQFLFENGYIEAKDLEGERFTLAPLYYRSVLRTLRNRHLLFT